MTTFKKNATTFEQQIDLITKRGLSVKDMPSASLFLRQVSYYRFSAYTYSYENLSYDAVGKEKRTHKFKEGYTFEDVKGLYDFDCSLKQLLFKGISAFEVSFRTAMAYYLAHKEPKNPYILYNNSCFKNPSWHKNFIESLNARVEKSKEVFIISYKEKNYDNFPQLPIWMAIEIFYFTDLSMFFEECLSDNDKKGIARQFGINFQEMVSWLKALSFFRNVCAHHGRLWNRDTVNAFSTQNLYKKDKAEFAKLTNSRTAFALLALNKMLSHYGADSKFLSTWKDEARSLISNPPNVPNFEIAFGIKDSSIKQSNIWF